MWRRDENGEEYDYGDYPDRRMRRDPTMAGGVFLLLLGLCGLIALIKEMFF